MSTFLKLVQDLHRESGASGQAPSTVLNQRGEAARLVAWISDADEYIQDLWENWKFLRQKYSEVTAIGVKTLPVAPNVAFHDDKTFKIIEAGETELTPIRVVEYDDIKDEIRDTTTGIPYQVVLMPDGTLEVDPIPDAAHTIESDYYRTAVTMTQDSDVSVIPPRFHKAILGYALVLYGNYENAKESKEQGQEIFGLQLPRLENNQLPNKFGSRYRTGGGFEVIAE